MQLASGLVRWSIQQRQQQLAMAAGRSVKDDLARLPAAGQLQIAAWQHPLKSESGMTGAWMQHPAGQRRVSWGHKTACTVDTYLFDRSDMSPVHVQHTWKPELPGWG